MHITEKAKTGAMAMAMAMTIATMLCSSERTHSFYLKH
jgi:hypothetical protein